MSILKALFGERSTQSEAELAAAGAVFEDVSDEIASTLIADMLTGGLGPDLEPDAFDRLRLAHDTFVASQRRHRGIF